MVDPDTDSVITDLSVLDTPMPYRKLPKSTDNSLNTEDFTYSSSDAVIKALQTLQQKIKRLELERKEAEKNFGALTEDTDKFKELVTSSTNTEKNTVSSSTEPMYALTPTKTSTPSDKERPPETVPSAFTRYNTHDSPPPPLLTNDITASPPRDAMPPSRDGIPSSRDVIPPSRDVIPPSRDVMPPSRDVMPPSREVLAPPPQELRKPTAVYCPSQDQPYATYVRHKKEHPKVGGPGGAPVKTMVDSRVSILEKQLEYMRRLVHNAEQERTRATEKLSKLEQKESQEHTSSTLEELRKQNSKILELELECRRLNSAHANAEEKIKDLEGKVVEEKDSHEKLFRQTEELARITEENKNLMLSITPSLPPSPPHYRPSPEPKRKQRSTRSTGSGCGGGGGGGGPETKREPVRAMPFVCGRSAYPSHSLSANVQQVLSLLQKENPTLCARISTQRMQKGGGGGGGGEVKQVIAGLEDDIGALTFEFQKLSSGEQDPETKAKLEYITNQMEKKSSHIKKLKALQKKMQSERVVTAKAVPLSAVTNNKEVQISLRGRNTRELLTKVKSIRDVLTNKDIQWV